MEEAAPTLELLDPALPEALLPGPLVEPWMILLAVMLVAGLFVFLVLKFRRKRHTIDPLAERAAAFEEARTALARMDASDARDAATRASLILRKYLSIAARDPALFETHEEFVSRSDSLQALSPAARSASESGFATLAAMKYSPDTPEADPASVRGEAESLLGTFHQGFAA